MLGPFWDHFGSLGLNFGDLGLRGCNTPVGHTFSAPILEPFWRPFGPLIFVRASLLSFFRYCLGVLKKLAEMTPTRVCPESLGRVPISTGAQFSFLEPNRNRAPKRMPKWSFWGATVLTILLVRHPWTHFGGLLLKSFSGPVPRPVRYPWRS